jgi:uncharacterized protein (TIGR03083 family)
VTIDAAAKQLDELLAALRHSHDRLDESAAPLKGEQLTADSYDDEWTIAQVLSHLGSGAEIFTLILDAGLHTEPPPGIEQFQAVWDRWNARNPDDQAREAIVVDAAFLDRIESLSQMQRARWRVQFFGAEQELPDILRMRLGEHALHTWDIAVALDNQATVAADAVALLVDTLDRLVARVAKPPDQNLHVDVSTWNPDRAFSLEVGPDGSRLSPTQSQAAVGDAALRMPAEAFLRLVYGRLDPEHTPPIESENVDLDTLRRVFPGV